MIKKLTVVSIGPGEASFLNPATIEYLRMASPLILRTDHHPLVSWLNEQKIPYVSMDELYEKTEDFDELSNRIAERIWELSAIGEQPVYGIPDPLTDHTVDVLFDLSEKNQLQIDVIPGFSYADFYLSRCRGKFKAASIRISSASDLLTSAYDPDETTLITEINSAIMAGELKTMLSSLLEDESEIIMLQGSEAPVSILLYEMDRQKHYDHLTAFLIPAADYLHRSRHTMRDLLQIMEKLRAPDGCPWDRIQTHESLQPYMVEEAWESIIAMDEKDPDHMADELGDLLFQIVFHASIGKAFDEFSMDDVITHICRKMISRHPHVFGEMNLTSPEEVLDRWESIKSRETGHKTVRECLEDVSPALPALKYAIKVNKKASMMPEWHLEAEDVAARIRNHAALLLNDHQQLDTNALGELLFLCTLLCYRCGEDGEIILHKTVDRFKKRFDELEMEIRETGHVPQRLSY